MVCILEHFSTLEVQSPKVLINFSNFYVVFVLSYTVPSIRDMTLLLVSAVM